MVEPNRWLAFASLGEGMQPDAWWAVGAVLLGSSVLGGLLTSTLVNVRAGAVNRRDGYAVAVKTLIARAEYPYRVRRRVSGDADILGSLVARGNDIQEQLAERRIWVASENLVVGKVYERVLAEIDSIVNVTTSDAWNQPPVTTASGMNLGGWGPGDQWRHIARLERAIAFRFGWRRLLPNVAWAWRFL